MSEDVYAYHIYDSKRPVIIGILDIGGDTAIIKAGSNLWHGKHGIEPELSVSINFPDIPIGVDRSKKSDVISEALGEALGQHMRVSYDMNGTLHLRPKNLEHIEASNPMLNELITSTPITEFEAKGAMHEDNALAMRALAYHVEDLKRNPPEEFKAMPVTGERNIQAGYQAMQEFKRLWIYEDPSKSKSKDKNKLGSVIQVPHYEGSIICDTKCCGAEDVEGLVRGVKQFIRDYKLEIGVTSVNPIRGGHYIKLYANVDAYKDLEKILKNRNPEIPEATHRQPPSAPIQGKEAALDRETMR